jgi:potassium-transporting ATPase KdpC subunit
MLREIRPAIVFIVAPALISGVAYPFAITRIARVVFPDRAQGSLLERDGKVVGSALIGHGFTSEGYFHGRPSATAAPNPNDPAKAVPAPDNANLGPTNKALIGRLGCAIAKLRQENPLAQVPGDPVTTPGSGPNPHIPPEAALFQEPWVAKARNLPENRVRQLVAENATDPFVGLFGAPHAKVFELNLALDRTAAR